MPQPAIRLLSEETARRIAAGEVIDRPAAVLRELLDNAIDSGAQEIACYIEEGGNARIRVVDDGGGITAAGLELCGRPHATSKIGALEDLDTLGTLGFRGEALASIAACARLEISSTPAADDERSGHRLVIEGGRRLAFEEQPPRPGTIVDVSKIFFNMPARKRFLKRPQTEGALCRAVFAEKALAFPTVSFRLWSDGDLVLYLPPATLAERAARAYDKSFAPDFLETVTAKNDGFTLTAVCSGPEVFRPDRKFLQIYVNRRRIFEYSLLQAVEFAYTGFLPGGLKPVAFVFIDIDPALVDFNIHPAKREVRFRNLPLLHSGLVSLVKGFLQKRLPAGLSLPFAPRAAAPGDEFDRPMLFRAEPGSGRDILKAFHTMQAIKGDDASPAASAASSAAAFRYLGQLWRVYLAALLADELILVDQHAAHERLLFDEAAKMPRSSQALAVPIAFQPEADAVEAIRQSLSDLERLGFRIVLSPTACEVGALPAELVSVPEAEVIAFLASERGSFADLERGVLARAACRAAVKAGEELDPVSAEELVRRALALPDPHCPHGRPVILRFSHDALDKLFQRIV